MDRFRFYLLLTLLLVALLAGCNTPELPSLPDLPIEAPDFSNLPAIPEALRNLPGVLEDLGLPDLSQIGNLPTLEDLPSSPICAGYDYLQWPHRAAHQYWRTRPRHRYGAHQHHR